MTGIDLLNITNSPATGANAVQRYTSMANLVTGPDLVFGGFSGAGSKSHRKHQALTSVSAGQGFFRVGVAGFEPTASSSRSNSISALIRVMLVVFPAQPSRRVRERPTPYAAVVAQLVTQSTRPALPGVSHGFLMTLPRAIQRVYGRSSAR